MTLATVDESIMSRVTTLIDDVWQQASNLCRCYVNSYSARTIEKKAHEKWTRPRSIDCNSNTNAFAAANAVDDANAADVAAATVARFLLLGIKILACKRNN
jgi:hypothetical protein